MLAEHALVDQPLVEQTGVGQHAHGHRAVDVGLELEQQHEVEPAVVAEAHAPDEVAVALLQLVADVARGQRGHAVEVEGVAPALGGESLEQVLDHAGLDEQVLVGGVVRPSRIGHVGGLASPAVPAVSPRVVVSPHRAAGGRPASVFVRARVPPAFGLYSLPSAGSRAVVRLGTPAHASCAGSRRSTPSG